MKKIIYIFLCIFLFSCADIKGEKRTEADYQSEWCWDHGGIEEVRLKDGTRVDCLTATHAIEFDFGHKWAEAPGQALHYARLTGKKPGIVLICRKTKDLIYLERLKDNIKFYLLNIKVWSIDCG